MAVDVATPQAERALAPRSLPLARLAALSARWWLAGLVLASWAGRFLAAAVHVTPYYLPDEYIYPSLARSLAEHGRPLIRNAPAHFPALLEPALAAPLWLVGGPATAYRLTQGLHALFFSLAALPVYLLARRLSVGKWPALGAAALAVAIPDGMYSGWMLSDTVSYPLVLFAVYFGICAVARGTRHTQLWFVAFSMLAMAARLQFFVVPLAVLAAAVVVERGSLRRVLRSLRLSLVLLALPPIALFGLLGPTRLLGPYMHTRVGIHPAGILEWFGRDALMLVYSSGWVLVPGALVAVAVGLLRPRTRFESAFAAVFVVLAVALLLEAAQIAVTDAPRYAERYLFALLPLVAVAFGRYVRRGLPGRLPVAVISAGLVALSARIPLSGDAAAHGRDDSPLLVAVVRLSSLVGGTAEASLAVAAVVAALSLLAFALPLRPRVLPAVAVAAAVAATAVASGLATSFDARASGGVRREILPRDKRWVDHSGLRDVALLQLPASETGSAWEQMFWNGSITSELLLGSRPIDQFASARVSVAHDGRMLVGGKVLRRPILAQTYGSTVRFTGARRVAHSQIFGLWKPVGMPRLQMLAAGRFYDGWLAGAGTITLWPSGRSGIHGRLELTLWLPRGRGKTVLTLAAADVRRRVTVVAGTHRVISFPVSSESGRWRLAYSANRRLGVGDLRLVSVKSSVPRFVADAG